MADILREEAERERRIQIEKEAILAAEQEAHKQKYAIVEKIRAEMAAKEAAMTMPILIIKGAKPIHESRKYLMSFLKISDTV